MSLFPGPHRYLRTVSSTPACDCNIVHNHDGERTRNEHLQAPIRTLKLVIGHASRPVQSTPARLATIEQLLNRKRDRLPYHVLHALFSAVAESDVSPFPLAGIVRDRFAVGHIDLVGHGATSTCPCVGYLTITMVTSDHGKIMIFARPTVHRNLYRIFFFSGQKVSCGSFQNFSLKKV